MRVDITILIDSELSCSSIRIFFDDKIATITQGRDTINVAPQQARELMLAIHTYCINSGIPSVTAEDLASVHKLIKERE